MCVCVIIIRGEEGANKYTNMLAVRSGANTLEYHISCNFIPVLFSIFVT